MEQRGGRRPATSGAGPLSSCSRWSVSWSPSRPSTSWARRRTSPVPAGRPRRDPGPGRASGARPVAGRAGRRDVAGERARRVVHVAMVAGLLATLALEVVKNLTSVRGAGLVAGGLAGGLLYASRGGLRCGCATWPRRRWSSPWCSCSCRRCPGWCCPSRAARPTPTRLGCASTRAPGGDDPAGRVPGDLAAGLGRSGRRPPVPRQPVHAARPVLRRRAVPGRHPALPGRRVRGDRGLGPVGGGAQDHPARLGPGLQADRLAPGRRREPDRAWLTADAEAERKPAASEHDGTASPVLDEIRRGDEPRQYYNFVQSIEGTDRPSFYFLHLLLPTSPGTTCPTAASTPTGATGATPTAGPPRPGRPSSRASAT
jgi:hypothetical protein